MNPNTTVTLYATDFDITNKHVVYADSEGAALAAVSSFPSVTFTNCYWQRTDGFVFRCNGNINEIERYNYCIFENDGKRNYAFITKCQYVNDAMTWVYLEIDPWLNFAGQYSFHDSPMRRCHPEADTILKGSYAAEPLTVTGWKQEVSQNGFYAPGDADDVFLVLSVDTTNMPDQATDLIQGLYDLLNYYGAGAAGLINWGNLSMKATSTRVGNKVQAATYHCSRAQAQQILNKLAANGFTNAAICAYCIPSYFRRPVGTSTSPLQFITTDGVTQEQITMNWGGATIFWNKIKYAPQFNQLIINLAGNSKSVPWGMLDGNGLINNQPITAELRTDMAMDGCETLKISGIDNGGADDANFILHSPQWDRTSLSGAAANQNKLLQTELATLGGIVRAGISAAAGSISGALSASETLIKGSSDIRETVNDSTMTIGGGGASIAGYNQTAPLFNASHFYPKEPELVKIQEYFGTYGYSWAGQKQKIVFQNMPHWNYYETLGAVITGRGVPQKYLEQVISMFNSGVFVYNSIGDYKKLENAMANHL